MSLKSGKEPAAAIGPVAEQENESEELTGKEKEKKASGKSSKKNPVEKTKSKK